MMTAGWTSEAGCDDADCVGAVTWSGCVDARKKTSPTFSCYAAAAAACERMTTWTRTDPS